MINEPLHGEEDLRALCYESAGKRYGQRLPDAVIRRLEEELGPIAEHGYEGAYLAAAQAARLSREAGYPSELRGTGGSSVVAYFLGISGVNPLPPHYMCKSCSYSEWLPEGSGVSPFDLPAKLCPDCFQPMTADGHDLPYWMFGGLHGTRAPHLSLYVAKEVQREVQQGLAGWSGTADWQVIWPDPDKAAAGSADSSLRPWRPWRLWVVPKGMTFVEFVKVLFFQTQPAGSNPPGSPEMELSRANRVFTLDILSHNEPEMMKRLHCMTGIDPSSIPMNDPKVLSLFRSTEQLGVADEELGCPVGTYGIPEMRVPFVRRMLEETRPSTFADLLQISGLSHGNGTWEGNGQESIRSGEGSLRTVIAFAEQLMHTLIAYGVDEELAYTMTNHVRRGKGLSGLWIDRLKKHGVPSWIIRSCQQIRYLFPKAHAIVLTISAVRHAFYKLYYPESYYSAYFIMEGDRLDLNVVLDGNSAIKEKIQSLEAGNPDEQIDPGYWLALEMSARGYRLIRDESLQEPFRVMKA